MNVWLLDVYTNGIDYVVGRSVKDARRLLVESYKFDPNNVPDDVKKELIWDGWYPLESGFLTVTDDVTGMSIPMSPQDVCIKFNRGWIASS